jgi:hypothetical protein
MFFHIIVLVIKPKTTPLVRIYDAPPTSLMGSIASPKMKTMKGEGIGACSLVRSSLGVKGRVGALGWGLRRMTSINYSHGPA